MDYDENGYFIDLTLPHNRYSQKIKMFDRINDIREIVVVNNPGHSVSHRPRHHDNPPTHEPVPDASEDLQAKRIKALQLCKENFSLDSQRKSCRDILSDNIWSYQRLMKACVNASNFPSKRLKCLESAQSFSFNPVKTITACNDIFNLPSQVDKCVVLSQSYSNAPLKVLATCDRNYDFPSAKLECIKELNVGD